MRMRVKIAAVLESSTLRHGVRNRNESIGAVVDIARVQRTCPARTVAENDIGRAQSRRVCLQLTRFALCLQPANLFADVGWTSVAKIRTRQKFPIG